MFPTLRRAKNARGKACNNICGGCRPPPVLSIPRDHARYERQSHMRFLLLSQTAHLLHRRPTSAVSACTTAHRHSQPAGSRGLCRNLASGGNIFTATARADSILYEGLIFSRFDTLYCILTTEYPEIPDKRLRVLAQDLEAPCKDVFEHYNLDDGLVNRSEYNHLISELITAVRLYFEQNPLLLRRAGRPRRNEKTEK